VTKSEAKTFTSTSNDQDDEKAADQRIKDAFRAKMGVFPAPSKPALLKVGPRSLAKWPGKVWELGQLARDECNAGKHPNYNAAYVALCERYPDSYLTPSSLKSSWYQHYDKNQRGKVPLTGSKRHPRSPRESQ
jgi:hypothetical protein